MRIADVQILFYAIDSTAYQHTVAAQSDCDGLALGILVHAVHAHQLWLAVYLPAARTAFSRFAIPSHGQV